MTTFLRSLLVLMVVCSASAALAAPVRILVDPGRKADGRATRPNGDWVVSTVPAAMAAVREVRVRFGALSAPVQVILLRGKHRLQEPVRIGPVESGIGGSLLVRAQPGGETILSGAKPVDGFMALRDRELSARLPEKARGNVLEVTLAESGIGDLGKLTQRGFGRNDLSSHAEVFFRGERMPLARWPNQGYLKFADLPDGKKGRRFTIDRELPTGLEKAPDLWGFGFWGTQWAALHVPMGEVDPGKKTLEVGRKAAMPYGFSPKNGRFYLENALALIDSPGEWYMDREAGKLYFWPPQPVRPGDVEVSQLDGLFRIEDARNVEVRGLTLEGVRGDAVTIENGDNVALSDCVIQNVGNRGVTITGVRSGVRRCELHAIGDSAVVLDGGDRDALTSGDLYVEDSELHDYGSWTRNYTAAAVLKGVGQRFTGNTVHDAPHMGVWYEGNNHVIEGNLFRNLIKDTGDAGAVYKWQDLAGRGTLIRSNVFCNINSDAWFAAGIYLDLLASGDTIVDNKFMNVEWGMLINGGSENFISSNLIVGSEYGIRFEPIGMTWSRKDALPPKGRVVKSLDGLPWQSANYGRRYPELPFALEDQPGVPKFNVIANNTFAGGKEGFFTQAKKAMDWQLVQGNKQQGLMPRKELAKEFPRTCLENEEAPGAKES